MTNPLHPEANTLANVIWSGRAHAPELEYCVAVVLATFFNGWCDEQKADLYAILAEKLDRSMNFTVWLETISRALWDNQNNWARRYG